MALAFTAASLLAFVVNPESEQVWDLTHWMSLVLWYLLLFAIVTGVVFAGALDLTGRMCRKRFSRRRVALLLPLWLWVMWMAAAGVLVCVVKLAFGDSLEWDGLVVGTGVLTLISYALVLPFLILSFTSSFYRERLKDLLCLPAPVAARAAAAPIAGQGSQP